MYGTWSVSVPLFLIGLLMIIFRRPIARKLANSKRFFLFDKLETILVSVLLCAFGVNYICRYDDEWLLGLILIGMGVFGVIAHYKGRQKLTNKKAIENYVRSGCLAVGIVTVTLMVLGEAGLLLLRYLK